MNILQLNDALITPGDRTLDNVRETRRRWLTDDGATRNKQIHLAVLRTATIPDLNIILRYLSTAAPHHATVNIRHGHNTTFVTADWTEPTDGK